LKNFDESAAGTGNGGAAGMEIKNPEGWDGLTPEQRKKKLFDAQKALLDTFLGNHAISKQQYDKSLGDLRAKMGIAE